MTTSHSHHQRCSSFARALHSIHSPDSSPRSNHYGKSVPYKLDRSQTKAASMIDEMSSNIVINEQRASQLLMVFFSKDNQQVNNCAPYSCDDCKADTTSRKLPRRSTKIMPTASSDTTINMKKLERFEKKPEETLLDLSHTDRTVQGKQQQQIKGMSTVYNLGDRIHSPLHMIVEPTYERATQAVSSLHNNDFAFVKRSDGSFSYTILACCRAFKVPKKGSEKNNSDDDVTMEEECMIFVMDGIGSTKTIRQRTWSECVRLVSPNVE